jgi:hypothetical protein
VYNYLSYFNLFESSTRHCIFFRNAFWHVHNCGILLSTHIENTRFLSYQFINPKQSQLHAAQVNFPTHLILLKIETCAETSIKRWQSLGQLLHGSILGNIKPFTLSIIIHAFNTTNFLLFIAIQLFLFPLLNKKHFLK